MCQSFSSSFSDRSVVYGGKQRGSPPMPAGVPRPGCSPADTVSHPPPDARLRATPCRILQNLSVSVSVSASVIVSVIVIVSVSVSVRDSVRFLPAPGLGRLWVQTQKMNKTKLLLNNCARQGRKKSGDGFPSPLICIGYRLLSRYPSCARRSGRRRCPPACR